jgi:hypothetical protein
MPVRRAALVVLAVLASAPATRAATIPVGPSDSYEKIEAAQPGDEVVVAPGTYRFRVHLTRQAPSSQPIVIRAQDPSNPPVWDLAGTLVEDAPGSYGAGDRGRGCWQISGGTNYRISGIVFTHCRNAGGNAAGLRYYGGARGIVVRDCVFREDTAAPSRSATPTCTTPSRDRTSTSARARGPSSTAGSRAPARTRATS